MNENIKLLQTCQIIASGFTEMTGRIYSEDGLLPTIQTMQGGNREPKVEITSINKNKLFKSIYRRITPRESWRFMGFNDKDFDAVKLAGMSDSQCYKQAGNSIVVNVLEAIFREML